MAKCKGCNTEITWGINQKTGRKIPLEEIAVWDSKGEVVEKPQLYMIGHPDEELRVIPVEGKKVWVSHFQTCPKASDFSRKK